MKYLEFNNRSSADFGLGIVSVKLGSPKPNLITETIPYLNGSIDFSTVATGGIQTYGDRTISIDFNYLEDTKEDMYKTYNKISSWLLSANKGALKFNYIDGIFTGKCTQISDLQTFVVGAKFTAIFTCNPLLDCGAYGSYIWDTFNFNKDEAEVSSLVVNAGDTMTIPIHGVAVNPTINVSSPINIELNNKQYSLVQGDNKVFGLNLLNGENKIKILSGSNVTLSLNFRKEYI
ncbi:phage tail domain-containing protein [Clostridium sp.]|uniref:phage tail domain-containing protein n=1 Tax=Clostridium sp. TaxID=1506 RepID=UPI003994EE5F